MQVDSIAVLMTYFLTSRGSQIFKRVISAISPVLPLIPQFLPVPSICLALSFVITLTTSAPQF